MKYAILLIGLTMIGLVACSKTKHLVEPVANILIEKNVSISAKPNFEEKTLSAGSSYFNCDLDGPDGKRSFFWPDDAPRPSELDENDAYQFDLIENWLQRPSGKTTREYSTSELAKVHDGETLLYDASVCSVHHTQMDRKIVQIMYGLPSGALDWKALRQRVPNDGTILGGCMVDVRNPEAGAWVCPTCKSVFDEAVARMNSEK